MSANFAGLVILVQLTAMHAHLVITNIGSHKRIASDAPRINILPPALLRVRGVPLAPFLRATVQAARLARLGRTLQRVPPHALTVLLAATALQPGRRLAQAVLLVLLALLWVLR